MRKIMADHAFEIKPEFFLVLALTLLMLPFKWVFAWVAAAAFHELCHYAAIKISRCGVLRVQINMNGAVMETAVLSYGKEALCALAGPLGGFALLLIASWFPRVAICGCFQSLYNLLPVFPLDGGRVVRSLLRKFIPEPAADRVSVMLEDSVLIVLGLLSLYAAFIRSLGPIPLIFTVILFVKSKKIKIPCKDGALRVQ